MSDAAPSLVSVEWLKDRWVSAARRFVADPVSDLLHAVPHSWPHSSRGLLKPLRCTCRLDDSSLRILDASWHMPNTSESRAIREQNMHQ